MVDNSLADGSMLEQLDLAFKPVANTSPRWLTPGQLEHYNRQGFVGPVQVFGAPEIAGIRTYVDGLMAAHGPDGDYGINCYQARLAGLWDIVTDPRILDPVEDIVGPNIVCWASHVLSKRPFDPKKVPWHQDASFWKLSPARTVTVWLAVDDVDEENSAMMFIPGTHRNGSLPIRNSSGDALFHIETEGADDLGEPYVNCLDAGQVSLHADMLVHGSLANRSGRRRCGLTIRYCPPDVRIVDSVWAGGVEAIICRGRDPTGHWRNHPRPDNDDIRRTSRPLTVGNN